MTADVEEETVVAAVTTPEPIADAAETAADTSAEQVVAVVPSAQASDAASIEPAAGTASGDYVVHLASVRSTEQAVAEWSRLTGIYQLPDTLAQVEPAKVTTDSGDFYRVWGGGFASEAAAAKVCEPITAQGDYCKVMKVN